MVTALVFGGALIVGLMIVMGVRSGATSRSRRGTANADGSFAYGDGGDSGCDSGSDGGSDGGGD